MANHVYDFDFSRNETFVAKSRRAAVEMFLMYHGYTSMAAFRRNEGETPKISRRDDDDEIELIFDGDDGVKRSAAHWAESYGPRVFVRRVALTNEQRVGEIMAIGTFTEINWHEFTRELNTAPDTDRDVLLAGLGGWVFMGRFDWDEDSICFRDSEGTRIKDSDVEFWAEKPKHPKR